MRLASSLRIWLVLTTAMVLALHAFQQLRNELENLQAVHQRELSLVATAVRSAVENALRDGQEPDVVSLLEQLELNDPSVAVFVFDAEGTLLDSTHGAEKHLDNLKKHMSGEVRPEPSAWFGLTAPDFVSTMPVRLSGSEAGRVAVVLPSAALLDNLARERNAVLLGIVVLSLAMALGIWLVVEVRLQRPVSHVIAVIRKVASGDLSARINQPGSDEIAELSREFDAMTRAMEETRKRLAAEIEAREEAEANMQRANKLVLVGELAATLAHEIGSPLQVLNGRATMLAERVDLPSDARRHAEILVEQTDRVIGIVERLLDVARRRAPAFEETDLNAVVRRMVEFHAPQAKRLGVSVEMALRDVPLVRADDSQVQQVLLNLLQNALRASQRGGKVSISLRTGTLELAGTDESVPAVVIDVEDTGQGFSEAVHARLFEPFFTQWHESVRGGTGLGLPVVKSIMADHGGSVSATSEPGKGARFTVKFPVRRAVREAS